MRGDTQVIVGIAVCLGMFALGNITALDRLPGWVTDPWLTSAIFFILGVYATVWVGSIESRRREARLSELRELLVETVLQAWHDIASSYGVSQDQGAGLTGGRVALHHKRMDLESWSDVKSEYQSLTKPEEFQHARVIFNTLNEVCSADLPRGFQRSSDGFVHTGDWIEGCHAVLIPEKISWALSENDLPERISSFIKYIGSKEQFFEEGFPRFWIPHPARNGWVIPYNWKDLYKKGYFERYKQPNNLAHEHPEIKSWSGIEN